MVGDWVLFVGLPYEIYRQTGSTLATGGMVLALLIPRIGFGSVAGVYVDRWDRRRLMIAVNLLLAAFLIPLLAVNALGPWVIYVVLIVESTLEQLFTPAEVALLPNLLKGGDEQLIPANALSGVNRHLARLIGPLIGGVVVAVVGGTSGGWKLLFGEWAVLGEEMLKLEVRACPRCAHVEFRVPPRS